MDRNLKEYEERGISYLSGNHLLFSELQQIMEVARTKGVWDGIAMGYFVGVCMGYERRIKEEEQKNKRS